MTKTAAKAHVQQAPGVAKYKAEQEGEMIEDIGLVQDTLVRASWNKLPGIWTGAFWSYMWKLLKSKGTAMYS
jgi:protein MBA1